MIGLAREAAVTYGKALTLHDPVVNGGGPGNLSDLLDVEIPATDLCPRYTARMVRNVKIGPSPKWMRDRLRASGVRPINNIVDITNYVMLECMPLTIVMSKEEKSLSDGRKRARPSPPWMAMYAT